MAWKILVEGHQRNIAAKLYWNRSSGFWGSFFVFYIDTCPKIWKRYIENKPCLLVAMLFDESWRLEQSWQRVTRGTFLPSYTEIGPVVSDKKNFEVYIDIQGNKPHPLAAIFFDKFWTILVEDHQRNISFYIILKSVQWFLTRRFLKFSV